jgi:hypothetical protein
MSDVNVLVGLASEFQDEPGPSISGHRCKMVPINVFPGCETAFVTMAISREMFDAVEDRSELAEIIADAVAAKVRKLVLEGPGAVLIG